LTKVESDPNSYLGSRTDRLSFLFRGNKLGVHAVRSVNEPRGSRLSDDRRFEELVLPHLNAAYNLARWLARDANDADDVVQDACVRALKYVGSLHGSDARAWFLTIVRHAFYDWLGRNRPSEIVQDDGTALDAAIDHAAVDPEQSASRNDQTQALVDAVAALPLQYREVLVLRELEELSYKEIARVADIPIGTVMSRLARARALLQRSPLLRAVAGNMSGSER
jgi:RNA polymerase sigma-70 factor (ECF subfamily)